jgi:hypothetical protein
MHTQDKNTARPVILLLVLSICLLFLGVGGFIGGYEMLRDPNGTPMGMPVSQLERTPFQNFFVPGLVLIFIWGCGSMLTLIGLWVRWQLPQINRLTGFVHLHWASGLSVLIGLGLIVWLTVQLFTLPAVIPLQFILYSVAVVLIVLPLFPTMRRYYRVEERQA